MAKRSRRTRDVARSAVEEGARGRRMACQACRGHHAWSGSVPWVRRMEQRHRPHALAWSPADCSDCAAAGTEAASCKEDTCGCIVPGEARQ